MIDSRHSSLLNFGNLNDLYLGKVIVIILFDARQDRRIVGFLENYV